MKKLILAAAIAAVSASTVNAATIYEGKGLTYKLKGDWQIQLRDTKKGDKANGTDVEFDDLELKNSITYDLGNGLKAFGQLDYSFNGEAENSNNDSGSLEEAYVGLDFGSVAVAVGKQDNAADEFGVEGAYEHTVKEDAFHAADRTDGDDVIRMDVEMDNFTLVASTELEAEGSANTDTATYEVFAATKVGGVELAAAYQTIDGATDIDVWGVSAATKLGSVGLAADYSSRDTGTVDLVVYNVVGKFKASKTTTIALGLTEEEKSATVDRTQIYANISYKFPSQKNVKLFAEISDIDEDGKDLDMDILAGMQIKF